MLLDRFAALCALLGAEGALLDGCVTYGRILFSSMPFFLLQYEFQSFIIAAERPQAGLYVTVASGVTNMVLDALLVAVFPLGLFGAAAATALSQVAVRCALQSPALTERRCFAR